MKKNLLILLSFLLSFNAVTKTVIHAGYLIDGSNDNPMNEMSIYVVDNKISEIVTGYIEPEPDDQYIDLSGYTVLPGLIDMHVHLTSNQSSTSRYTESTSLNPADYAIRSVNNAKQTLNTAADLPPVSSHAAQNRRNATPYHPVTLQWQPR